MDDKTNKKIYRKYKAKGIKVNHVCEVGVYLPALSNIYDFITKDKIRTTLVEPDPKSIGEINKLFKNNTNVTLYPVAIYDYNGVLELVQRNASTFAAALPASPAMINDHYEIKEQDKFTVECKRFDEIDDGSIELLSVDTEGCEWFILKYMKSRPLIISLETHGKSYLNPYLKEISGWVAKNEYGIWFMDKTDTVFYKRGAFQISALERIQLSLMNAYVKWRRWRKGGR